MMLKTNCKNILKSCLLGIAVATATATASATEYDFKTLEKSWRENINIRKNLLENLTTPAYSKIEGDNFDKLVIAKFYIPTAEKVRKSLINIEKKLEKTLLSTSKISKSQYQSELFTLGMELQNLKLQSININDSSFSSCHKAIYKFKESTTYGTLYLAKETAERFKEGAELSAMCGLMIELATERNREVYLSTDLNATKEPPYNFCKKINDKNYQKDLQMWSCNLQRLKQYINK